MSKQILTRLSTHTIHLGTHTEPLEVTVKNLSDRFATFALELSASGLDRQTAPDWYNLTPDISAKIPVGDQTHFQVNILDAPPIPGGFSGKMNLKVNVTCLELGEEDRQLVNLVVGGSGVLPPTLQTPTTNFQAFPGDLVEIPLEIYNPNRNTANIRVAIKGLPDEWITNGCERRLQVSSRSRVHALFICQPPHPNQVVSQVYPFEIEMGLIGAPRVCQPGSLEILPTGQIDFTCAAAEAEAETEAEAEAEAETPADAASTHYTVKFNNNSNVDQSVALTLTRIDRTWHERFWAFLRRRPPQPAPTTEHVLRLSPAQVFLKAGDIAKMALTVAPRSPWLGWRRRQQFRLRPQLQQTDVQPPAHTLELIAPPKIPFWAQCLGLACLGLAAITESYWGDGHGKPVNSVQFDGQGNAIISAADDQKIHRWQSVNRLREVDTLKASDKVVRVVRYRPRNNNLLAAGLENGEIQLWDFLAQPSPQATLVFQKDDRVFDLRFSRDSQSLFSAHGSGRVLRWAIGDIADQQTQQIPKQTQQFGFAIQAIALVGQSANILAVGGRFNQLALWNFEQGWSRPINDLSGEPVPYIGLPEKVFVLQWWDI